MLKEKTKTAKCLLMKNEKFSTPERDSYTMGKLTDLKKDKTIFLGLEDGSIIETTPVTDWFFSSFSGLTIYTQDFIYDVEEFIWNKDVLKNDKI